MSRCTRSCSSPFGPLTRTVSGSIATVTPAGTVIGCLPILDILVVCSCSCAPLRCLPPASDFPLARSPPLPHLRQNLAAYARRAGVVTGHHAVGGRDDRGAHPALHLRDPSRLHVGPLTRSRNALEARDRRAAVGGVLETDLDHLARAAFRRRLHRPAFDVALLGEDPRELRLELGGGNLHGLVRRVDRVADARQKVGYRVGHGHWSARERGDMARGEICLQEVDGGVTILRNECGVSVRSAYQEDLVIPGIWPLWASSRKQMRQSPNLRY